MRVILAIIFLLCVIDAFAQEPNQKVPNASIAPPQRTLKKKLSVSKLKAIVSLGVGALVEKANDGLNYEPRTLFFLRGGVQYYQHEALLEIGGFKQSPTGSSGVEISRFHQQIDLWYHYLFFLSARVGHPYAGLAIGMQRDEVTTTFFGQTTKDTGVFEAQLSLGGGYRFNFGENFTLWLEGRLATSDNYEPKVLPSAVVVAGFRF